jgi:hypothetical protein
MHRPSRPEDESPQKQFNLQRIGHFLSETHPAGSEHHEERFEHFEYIYAASAVACPKSGLVQISMLGKLENDI